MNSSSRPPSKAGMLLRLSGTILTIALLIYLLGQQGWHEIGQAFLQISPWRFFLALGFMILSRLFVAARWHVLLQTANVNTSYKNSLQITLAGLFATNFLPTTIGGDMVRLAGALRMNIDAAIAAASLVVDRLVGMTGMAMVLPFGLPSFFQANQQQGMLPGVTFSLSAISAPGWLQNIWQKGLGVFLRITDALRLWLKNPRSLLLALLFSWAHMLCFFSVLWLLLGGLGENLSFWLTGGLYSLVYFVTLLPFSINGYGLQEISMTLVFSRFGGADVSSGLTLALLFRTLTMLASLPGALFVPGLLQKRPKPGKDQ